MLQATFQIEFDDFVEACNAYAVAQRNKGKPPKTQPWAWGMIAGVTLLGLGLILWQARTDLRLQRDLAQLVEQTSGAAPWAALAMVSVGFFVASRARRTMRRVVFFSALLIIGAAAAFYVKRGTGAFLFRLIPWVVVVGLWCSSWRALVGNTSYRALWDKQSYLHGPNTFTCDEDGFELAGSLCSRRFRWPALKSWIETSDLFILLVSDLEFHVVPKRAFSGATQESEFRDTLINASDHRAAFPVIPL
ncbi:MAG TPA: YcxB family protein [Tepidisphaeraceae bacterium]|jgi:hypothetical protein